MEGESSVYPYFNSGLTDLCVDLVDISHPPAKNVGCDVDSVLVPEVRSLAASPLNLRPGVTNHTSHHATKKQNEKNAINKMLVCYILSVSCYLKK